MPTREWNERIMKEIALEAARRKCASGSEMTEEEIQAWAEKLAEKEFAEADKELPE